MSLVFREIERVEARVLGAIRCVDASTRAGIATPLAVQIAGAGVRRNRSGLYVITRVDDPVLNAHASAFDVPPATPAIGSVSLGVTLSDPAGRYLPRLATIALPRDPQAAQPWPVDSLFRPIDIAMYPASVAPVGANWAVLRASVREAASGDALGGALLIVTSNGATLARAMSDWRGEALVAVPGVPVTTWSDDPDAVVVSEIAAQVEVVFDAATGQRTPAAQVRDGRAPQARTPVDPDAVEAARAVLPNASQALTLAAGRTQNLSLSLPLPLALP